MNAPEKRKKPRIHRQYSAQIQADASGAWEIITLQNLSPGGLLFLYHKSLAIGTIIKAKINFPPSDGIVGIQGQVIRSTPKGPVYDTAIAFSDMTDEHRALINHFAVLWSQ